jgi:hypothetical protein
MVVQAELTGAVEAVRWAVRDHETRTLAEGTAVPSDGRIEIRQELGHPKLWWPHTHGRPYLYRLELTAQSGSRASDQREVPFGVRSVRPVLLDATTGEPRFCFEVNGAPIFLRGACLAPVEGMSHCWPHAMAMHLLNLLVHARMNVLRVWGEGYIPPDAFYDECDRRGILIWQDFMFGYGMHPADDAAFAECCRNEIEEMIRRLRRHPCLLLWCGGNENHMGWDFAHGTPPSVGTKLFEDIMPAAVARLDPDRFYHPSSPHGGCRPNSPLQGDWHDYTTLKFCPQASVPLYASETGAEILPAGVRSSLCVRDRARQCSLTRQHETLLERRGSVAGRTRPRCADPRRCGLASHVAIQVRRRVLGQSGSVGTLR